MLISSSPSGSASPRVLLLSPSVALAHPRGWQAITQSSLLPAAGTRYDEIHCAGGGALLLFLLMCSRRSPRGPKVIMHGEMVAPTAESCARWCERAGASTYEVNTFAWRSQAVMAMAGGLEGDARWLEPLLRNIAMGRGVQVEKQFFAWADRWARHGRLVHAPDATDDDDLLRSLCSAGGTTGTGRGGTRTGGVDDHGNALSSGGANQILRCGEFECADHADACALPAM